MPEHSAEARPARSGHVPQAALVTPAGIGGVAVVQICGLHPWECVRPWLQDLRGRPAEPHCPDRPTLLRWCDDEEVIDDVVVTLSSNDPLPGERVTVAAHGGIRVIECILAGLNRSGAEIVTGLDMEQAWSGLQPIEAAVMRALPGCSTRRVAAWLLQQVPALAEEVRACQALLREDKATAAVQRLHALQSTQPLGGRLLQGASAVIVGPPNAGKSTLANRLFDRPWSLESPEAGTTRDWVQQGVAIDGIPFALADTAGLRRTTDDMERAAMAHNRPLIESADLRIVVLDCTSEPAGLEEPAMAPWILSGTTVVVLNKVDLLSPARRAATLPAWKRAIAGKVCDCIHLEASALTAEGLGVLRRAIVAHLLPPHGTPPCPAIWESLQGDLLQEVLECLPGDARAATELLRRGFLSQPA